MKICTLCRDTTDVSLHGKVDCLFYCGKNSYYRNKDGLTCNLYTSTKTDYRTNATKEKEQPMSIDITFRAEPINRDTEPIQFNQLKSTSFEIIKGWNIYSNTDVLVGAIAEYECKTPWGEDAFYKAGLFRFLDSDKKAEKNFHTFDEAFTWIAAAIHATVYPLIGRTFD